MGEKMSLLRKLQTALSKVSGNHITEDYDGDYSEYYCHRCKGRVKEDEYNHLKSQCYKCWYEGDFDVK